MAPEVSAVPAALARLSSGGVWSLRPEPVVVKLLAAYAVQRSRTLLAQDIQDAIHDQYGDGITIFEPVVRRSVRFAESAVAGQSIIAYDPSGPGAKAYRAIAKRILENSSHG